MSFALYNLFKKSIGRFAKIKAAPKIATDCDFESCIICGKKTKVKKDTLVEHRECYQIGCGQLCESCHYKLLHENNKF